MSKRYYFINQRKRSWLIRFLINVGKNILGAAFGRNFKELPNTKRKKLTTTINNLLFNQRNAEEISLNSYINFENKKYYEIEYGEYTVPAFTLKNKENVKAKISLNKNQYISLGFGILDEKVKNIEDYHLLLKFFFKSDSNEFKRQFSFPLNRGKTLLKTVGSYFRGKEFLEVSLSAESLEIPFDEYDLTIEMIYERNSKKPVKKTLPKIAIKSPRVFDKHKKNKKIILISCESLTDPYWLQSFYDNQIELPGFDILVNDGVYFPNSYSQQDGTLPFMSTMSTGLFSTQHLLGDYSKPIFQHQLHNNVNTLSELLSSSGFSTEAVTPQGRWDTSYGWSRGYDSFKVTKCAWDDSAPNSNNLSNLILKNKDNSSFIFAHIDRMHIPLLQFVPSQSPSLHNLEDLHRLDSKNFYPTIFNQLKKLDKIIYDIINTLKYSNQYDDTLIVLTGDHGISVPPNWKKGLEFPQYEEHIRVPYIIKEASWGKKLNIGDPKRVNNASTRIFQDIISSAGLNFPQYFKNTSQFNENFKDYAFSETIFHPSISDCGLSIISKDVKYWFNCKMNWKTLDIQSTSNEKIFFRDKNGNFDEKNNVINENKSMRSNYNEIGVEFLKKNLSFHSENFKPNGIKNK